VNCDEARETVSAAADGEASAAERATLDVHLGGCAGCRAFLRRVEQVGRMARVRPAEPVPDLVGRVTGGAGPLRLGRGGWMRPALAWVAVVLAGQNVPALVLGETAGADSHLARHLGAFGVALAIGFAYVAWRPHRAIGLLPLVAALQHGVRSAGRRSQPARRGGPPPRAGRTGAAVDDRRLTRLAGALPARGGRLGADHLNGARP
jgi:predicted anti-sigma-YlaC factor YlaD